MNIVESIVLGVVQGLTEFLPVSSSGHLVLVHSILGTVSENPLAFDVMLHVATALAVIVYFWNDLMVLGNALLRKLSRLPVNQRDLTLLAALAAGTIPAVILGLSLEYVIETYFRFPLVVAGVLFAGSLFFMYTEWYYDRSQPLNEMSIMKGLQIGFFQSIALIPGVSRSGITICGGMLLGLTRSEAARFAFLLAIPVIVGAGAVESLRLIGSPESIQWGAIGVGALVAFLTGLAAIHFMISFVRKYSLWPFIWYRIILAGFVVFVVVFG